jgi:thioredoxin-like negative regulator of GroEL
MAAETLLAGYTRPTLIEVMAPHCVECRAMQPDVDAVAGANSDIVDFVPIDASRDLELASALGVMGTPTLIAVKDGVEIARFTGRRSRTELEELFAAVASGSVASISKVSKSDRIVWSFAGALLAGAGLLMGPAWILVAVGAGLAAYANLPRSRGGANG